MFAVLPYQVQYITFTTKTCQSPARSAWSRHSSCPTPPSPRPSRQRWPARTPSRTRSLQRRPIDHFHLRGLRRLLLTTGRISLSLPFSICQNKTPKIQTPFREAVKNYLADFVRFLPKKTLSRKGVSPPPLNGKSAKLFRDFFPKRAKNDVFFIK